MVTHELDIASYAKRNVIMRDGQIMTDEPVARRLNAEGELGRLRDAHRRVMNEE
jgi:putative ABC transport system ATP-binding protein